MLYGLLATSISENEMTKIVTPVLDVCNVLVPVLLSVVGAVGAIYCIVLGIKYAKADDPQEHEKAKKVLINAIIGFVLIFILLIMLQVGLGIFKEWWSNYAY
ncbi:MAG: Mbov_0395 family pilin-like conjugal transfer protein [Candidatus Coproplasma sp.]